MHKGSVVADMTAGDTCALVSLLLVLFWEMLSSLCLLGSGKMVSIPPPIVFWFVVDFCLFLHFASYCLFGFAIFSSFPFANSIFRVARN